MSLTDEQARPSPRATGYGVRLFVAFLERGARAGLKISAFGSHRAKDGRWRYRMRDGLQEVLTQNLAVNIRPENAALRTENLFPGRYGYSDQAASAPLSDKPRVVLWSTAPPCQYAAMTLITDGGTSPT
jgi:hypothetical protein